MPSLTLLSLIAMPFLVSAAAPAPDDTGPDIDPESSEALEEILASDALVEEEEAVLDVGRWAVRDLLAQGFAQTPVLERVIAGDELGFMRNESWMQALERETLLARLRPVPAHQAREVSRRLAFDIPLADHPLVDSYIDYFTGRGRWFFAKWLARADRYLPIMQPILEARGLPRDLVYVAMIESGFSSRAVSTASACGFWQFIGSTGRIYKLRADVWMDERRDFVRSTEAAASYLTYLYAEFDDWHLAWAGYNAGEGRVRRAIAKYGVRDFWTLAGDKHAFAKETQHYVPKIIAAAIVAKDRAKYGFTDIEPLPPLEYDEVEVEDATELGAVARKLALDVEQLRELNPALTFGVTPPGRRAVLRVPAGRGPEVAAWLVDLPREQRLSYAHHRVQKGDSLYKIARVHGSSVDAIREFNQLHARYLKPGQTLVIPVSPGRRVRSETMVSTSTHAKRRTVAAKPSKSTKVASTKAVTRHRVARGETLWSIAQRYGVSVSQVKSWNARRSNAIQAGEVLEIHVAAASSKG